MEEKKQIRMSAQQLMQTFIAENSKLEEVGRRINAVFMAIQEISTATASLEALEAAKDSEKMLVPLGAGVFLNSSVKDGKNVLFSLAGGVMKTKKNEEARKELEKRKQELEKILDKSRQEHSRLLENVNVLGSIIRQGQRQNRQRPAR